MQSKEIKSIDCPINQAYSSKNFPDVSCVYFLFEQDKLKYIGKTKSLQKRMQGHLGLTSYKIFNEVKFIEIDDPIDRDIFETDMINKHNPPDNGVCWF
jgi:excinuclease UvrABC nuclease subunit